MRLGAGGEVGVEIAGAVEAGAVERTGGGGGFAGEIAVAGGIEGVELWGGICFDGDFNGICIRGPEAEVGAAIADEFGADGETPLELVVYCLVDTDFVPISKKELDARLIWENKIIKGSSELLGIKLK